MTTNRTNLPANDGFSLAGYRDRLLQGVILRCVDGNWSDKDGVSFPHGTRMLVLGVDEALQCWQAKQLLDEIRKVANQPLPSVDELNAKIPETEWDEGLDGKPRPPWSHVFAVYLLDITDGSIRTFINSTTGAGIAYERLKDKVAWMRHLRGAKVVPIVELQSRQMRTKVGQKLRPDFQVVDWRELGGGDDGSAAPALPGGGDGGASGAVLEALKQPNTAEPVKERAKPDKRPKGLKPVKPVSTGEQLNDDIPWLG